MMEIEYKYLLPKGLDPDVTLNEIKGDKACEIALIPMHARYFDTDNFDFKKAGVFIRARLEDGEVNLTCKWKSGENSKEQREGLHQRGESNVRGTEADFDSPDLGRFKNEPCYGLMANLVGADIKPVIEMEFLRKEAEVFFGKGSSAAVSVDKGEIRASGKTAPIYELEIEFRSGDIDEFIEYSEKISGTYGLIPENKSKYVRGLSLLEK